MDTKTSDNKFRTGCIDFTAGSLGKYVFVKVFLMFKAEFEMYGIIKF